MCTLVLQTFRLQNVVLLEMLNVLNIGCETAANSAEAITMYKEIQIISIYTIVRKKSVLLTTGLPTNVSVTYKDEWHILRCFIHIQVVQNDITKFK